MQEQKKKLVGVVTSDKMDKTVVVTVTALKRHKMYGKTIRRSKKFQAHDESNECSMGDRVQIIESRPRSRHKRWEIVEILEKAE